LSQINSWFSSQSTSLAPYQSNETREPVDYSSYLKPDIETAKAFHNLLIQNGITKPEYVLLRTNSKKPLSTMYPKYADDERWYTDFYGVKNHINRTHDNYGLHLTCHPNLTVYDQDNLDYLWNGSTLTLGTASGKNHKLVFQDLYKAKFKLRTKLADGLAIDIAELLLGNNYIVAPGSCIGGKYYTIKNPASIATITRRNEPFTWYINHKCPLKTGDITFKNSQSFTPISLIVPHKLNDSEILSTCNENLVPLRDILDLDSKLKSTLHYPAVDGTSEYDCSCLRKLYFYRFTKEDSLKILFCYRYRTKHPYFWYENIWNRYAKGEQCNMVTPKKNQKIVIWG
jgi:hypothetical protein